MSQAEIIEKFNSLSRRCEDIGITLKIVPNEQLGFFDVPGSNGFIGFDDIDQLEIFVRGYELGYNLKR